MSETQGTADIQAMRFSVLPQLTANQWKIVTFCSLAGMLETMDMYIISFVLSVITGPWGLSYGQSAAILYASGIGGLIGAFFWGYVADKVGRKKAFLGTIIMCAGPSLLLAFTPEGNWIFIAIMRSIIGFGAAGFFIFIVLVQEFAPAANRGFASSFVSTAAATGLMVGALCASFLMPLLGWRGMFAIGALPILVGIAVQFAMPESPRWALAHGHAELGRRSLRWALGENADLEPIVQAYSTAHKQPRYREVFALKRSLASGVMVNFGVVSGFYGLVMWAPTMLAQVLEISGTQAARIMLSFSLIGLTSRLGIGWLSDRFGRRRCGAVAACGAATFLVIAGLVGHGDILSRDLFWLPFGIAFVLADSSFAVMGMYTSEIWPSRLRGRGSGTCYAAGGVGKIVGPLGLALLIGSSNLIRPAATVSAIVPAFVFLGSVFLIGGLAYIFIARETRGQSLEDLERQLT